MRRYQMHNNCFLKELYYLFSRILYARLKDLDDAPDAWGGKICAMSSTGNGHEKGQHTHGGVAGPDLFQNAY